MDTIYWTKPILVFDEGEKRFINTGELEEIKECKDGYVPDGDGFEVNMNGIKYKSYLKKPERYRVENGILMDTIEEAKAREEV